MSPIYDAQESDFIREDGKTPKEVHIVTHPLFDLFNTYYRHEKKEISMFNPELWQESKTAQEYFENNTIHLFNTLIEKNNRGQNQTTFIRSKAAQASRVRNEFINISRLYSAQSSYKEIARDINSVVIFLLPNGFHERPEFMQVMSSIPGTNQVFFMESDTQNSGGIKSIDIEFLQNNLPNEATIVSSGGYVGKCLSSTVKALTYNEIPAQIDYSLAISPGTFDDPNLINVKPSLPSNPIKTIDELVSVIEINEELLKQYNTGLLKERLTGALFGAQPEAAAGHNISDTSL